MKKTIQIEGMMCAHCEATVKKALEALPGSHRGRGQPHGGTAVRDARAPVGRAPSSRARSRPRTIRSPASRGAHKAAAGHPRRDAPAVFCSLLMRVDRLREQPVLRAVPQQCAVREVRQARLRAPVRV